jgi:hypothetical protein
LCSALFHRMPAQPSGSRRARQSFGRSGGGPLLLAGCTRRGMAFFNSKRSTAAPSWSLSGTTSASLTEGTSRRRFTVTQGTQTDSPAGLSPRRRRIPSSGSAPPPR